jgi:hypothetical protein
MKIYTGKELQTYRGKPLVYLLDIEVETSKLAVHQFYKIGYSQNIFTRYTMLGDLDNWRSEVKNKGYLVTRMYCIGLFLSKDSLALEQKFHRGIDFRLRYLGNYLTSGNSEIYKKDSRVLEYARDLGIEFG